MKKSDVIRKMRPYQRSLAPMIIDDTVSGAPPISVADAIGRYAGKMGEALTFAAGDWQGDIREAAIWTLLRNGFAKGKMVKMSAGGDLSRWTGDRTALEAAAAIETEFGGNRALSERAMDIVAQAKVVGMGERAVYVYTDSRLDALGDHCTKIGTHHLSGSGEVLKRIIAQYSTGNPGHPVLRIIVRTDTDVALESHLHRRFKECRISGGFGTEWFSVSHQAVLAVIEEFHTHHGVNLMS